MNKDFILQRICIFSGKDVDPNSDEQIIKLLRDKFNIRLPQRPTLNEALSSSGSEHEIIHLILQYRSES
ncbi:MAG: DNA polymerase I-like protein with 3'-5' exonuclease and polymerase domains [Alteromonadaceae bacterium]|jgi:DNA polymerase I-like protein with 3'-5' exonuclease and polymerase domains